MKLLEKWRMKRLTEAIVSRVRPYSMVSGPGLTLTISETLRVIAEDRPGDLAEFGTWMGGSSFAMLLAQRRVFGKIIKPVWMFDSFQGLPPAGSRDGLAAAKYQQDVDSPGYFDNCTAPIEKVRQAKAHFGFSDDEAIIVPGWFEDTLPANIGRISAKGLSLLRIDCDWYDPVKLVLDNASSLVAAGGAIILDDYYSWDGCARATHDFLAGSDLPYRIRSQKTLAAAWMVKPNRGSEESP